MASTETREFTVQTFALSENSTLRESYQLLRLTNLFCECFVRTDHRDVETMLERELRYGQQFFIAVERIPSPTEVGAEHLSPVGFASWHPDGEARTGTGELRYIGWLQSVQSSDVVPSLLVAIEEHATRWFIDKFRYTRTLDPDSKQMVKVEVAGFDPAHPPVRLRRLFAQIPAIRPGARVALEAVGFRFAATLPGHIYTAMDALYLYKDYPSTEAKP